jgi:hypothetical protein
VRACCAAYVQWKIYKNCAKKKGEIIKGGTDAFQKMNLVSFFDFRRERRGHTHSEHVGFFCPVVLFFLFSVVHRRKMRIVHFVM